MSQLNRFQWGVPGIKQAACREIAARELSRQPRLGCATLPLEQSRFVSCITLDRHPLPPSTDTTSPYSASWNTTTATDGSHSLTARAFDAANNQTTSGAVSVTVSNGGAPPVLDITLSGVPATIQRGQLFTATGTVANTGNSSATGYSVVISFTPSDSMRLENPQNATQSVATVAAGGSQNVSWQIRADRAGSATLTMTLRNSAGATVDTISRTISITD